MPPIASRAITRKLKRDFIGGLQSSARTMWAANFQPEEESEEIAITVTPIPSGGTIHLRSTRQRFLV
jgi:hypothetical protein